MALDASTQTQTQPDRYRLPSSPEGFVCRLLFVLSIVWMRGPELIVNLQHNIMDITISLDKYLYVNLTE